MENKLFGVDQIRNTFGLVPSLKGTQQTAVKSASDLFVGISTIMAEGKVLPAHLEYANQKLWEAQIAVNSAITHGFNNGQVEY